jgi:hypothetical protein
MEGGYSQGGGPTTVKTFCTRRDTEDEMVRGVYIDRTVRLTVSREPEHEQVTVAYPGR